MYPLQNKLEWFVKLSELVEIFSMYGSKQASKND